MSAFISTSVASAPLNDNVIYKALDFLNFHIEDKNTTDEILLLVLNLTKHDYTLLIEWLKLTKYIEKRTDNINNDAWKITRDGQKKLEELHRKLNKEKIEAVAKSTKKAVDIVKILGAVGSAFVILECLLLFQQNQLMTTQNHIMLRQYILDSISKAPNEKELKENKPEKASDSLATKSNPARGK